MAELSPPPRKDEDFDAPTLKRTVPAELRDVDGAASATTKPREAGIEALLTKERNQSGMRRAVSDEDVERFARRDAVKLPAPPATTAEHPNPLSAGAAKSPPLPTELADLDADDER